MDDLNEFRILVLTDHSTHSDQNSFYGIVNGLLDHKAVGQVSVASRGEQKNHNFFNGRNGEVLYTLEIQEPVSFSSLPGKLLKATKNNIKGFDFILLRLPRPIPDEFFLMLMNSFDENRIINRPSGIMVTSSKEFLLNLSKWCPPMRIINEWSELMSISREDAVVLKPFFSYGGKGIIRIMGNKVSREGTEDLSLTEFKDEYESYPIPYLAMKYLKNVHLGDKRIVVAGGKVLTASLRLPPAASWICNIAMGGTAEYAEVDQREQSIIHDINPLMEKHGIFLYGLDTLVDDDGERLISEINTLSVGGITPAEKYNNRSITADFIKYLIEYCNHIWKTKIT